MIQENSIVDLLTKRRSVRKFQPQQVEKCKVDQLIKAALLSPTSKNRRPWEFIIVTDQELLRNLSEAKPHGATFLKNAPLGIIAVGDEETSDVWIEDTSIASINIQLAAEAMGLGSCWIQIRKREHNDHIMAENFVRGVLAIPETMRVLSMIAIGYPEEQRPAYTEEVLDYNKIYNNRHGNGSFV